MSKHKPSIEELKSMVFKAEISADLSQNPELRKHIETILRDVDSQRVDVKNGAINIIEIINSVIEKGA